MGRIRTIEYLQRRNCLFLLVRHWHRTSAINTVLLQRKHTGGMTELIIVFLGGMRRDGMKKKMKMGGKSRRANLIFQNSFPIQQLSSSVQIHDVQLVGRDWNSL